MKRCIPVVKEQPATFVSVNQTTHICDWCAKEVSDYGETYIRGSPDGGWYHIGRTPKSTSLPELKRTNGWDFCSFECLSRWVNGDKQRGLK